MALEAGLRVVGGLHADQAIVMDLVVPRALYEF